MTPYAFNLQLNRIRLLTLPQTLPVASRIVQAPKPIQTREARRRVPPHRGVTKQPRTHGAVLLECEVAEIKYRLSLPHRRGLVPILARRYGVNRTTIQHILNEESWQHVLPLAPE